MNLIRRLTPFELRDHILSNLNRLYSPKRWGIVVDHQAGTFRIYYCKLGLYMRGSTVEWGDKFHEYFKKLD
jgi:hypothetical protein